MKGVNSQTGRNLLISKHFSNLAPQNSSIQLHENVRSLAGILLILRSSALKQWRIQDLPKGGRADHGERAQPKRGSPQRGCPPEAESFLYNFTQKKWPKVKDLSRLGVKATTCKAKDLTSVTGANFHLNHLSENLPP